MLSRGPESKQLLVVKLHECPEIQGLTTSSYHHLTFFFPLSFGSTCCHGDSNTIGQVGSLLLGNEMLEVQDWLLRSKGAERMIREGGKVEKHPRGDTKAQERSRRQDQGEKRKIETRRENTQPPWSWVTTVYLLGCPQ